MTDLVDALFSVDWRALFIPQVPILELILRGSIMYLGLFLLMRFILKREVGAVSVTDLLVVVLLADAAQNAMAGGYETITDGLILVTVIIGWSYILDWLGFHFEWIQRLIYPRPLLLVEEGHIQWQNMRWELITEDELMSHLRQQGIQDLSEVETVYMEGKGQMSVITKKSHEG